MKAAFCALGLVLLSAGLPIVAGNCPSAVSSAIANAHPGAATLSCSSEREAGTTVYEAKIRTAAGQKLELEIDPGGTILLTEEQIATKDVPAAVLDALHARYADAKLTEAERLTATHGEISYEVAFTSGGHRHEMTVTEAGALIGSDDDDRDDEDD